MTVNSTKLTKLERKILLALSNPNLEKDDLPEGKSTRAIGMIVFGDKARAHYGRSDRGTSQFLMNSARSSLSRVLKQLLQKRLVIKCTPKYRYRWLKFSDGFNMYAIGQTFLKRVSVNEQGQQVGEYMEIEHRHYPP